MNPMDAFASVFPPRPPYRFDLNGAMKQFLDAATDWAITSTMSIALGVVDENSYHEAHTRMQCAAAIFAWELGRTTTQGIIPGAPRVPSAANGADYDDDTINALLSGSR